MMAQVCIATQLGPAQLGIADPADIAEVADAIVQQVAKEQRELRQQQLLEELRARR